MYFDWSNGRLIKGLQQIYPNLSLAFFNDCTKKENYNFRLNPAKVYTLPFPLSYPGGLKNSFKINQSFNHISKENDLLIIQLPFISPFPLLFLAEPVIYHICANVLTASRNPIKYRGMHKLMAVTYAYFMHMIHRSIFSKKRNRVLVNGNELGALYKRFQPKVVISSSVKSSEILTKEQIPAKQKKQFNFLFIGRPSLEKGFDLVVQALNILRKDYVIHLQVLGFSKESFEHLMPNFADRFGDDIAWIDFRGFVGYGDEFKSICINSHALLLPSRSEGTPRVLIEARAFGCPVIASDTGGITSSVNHEYDGLLFKSGDLKELIETLERFMSDSNLRRSLAEKGLITANKYSLEYFVNQFVNSVNSYNEV